MIVFFNSFVSQIAALPILLPKSLTLWLASKKKKINCHWSFLLYTIHPSYLHLLSNKSPLKIKKYFYCVYVHSAYSDYFACAFCDSSTHVSSRVSRRPILSMLYSWLPRCMDPCFSSSNENTFLLRPHCSPSSSCFLQFIHDYYFCLVRP